MGIVDTSKIIVDLVKAGATIELQEQAMNLRVEALELQNENLTLRQRISELEAEAALTDEMVFEKGIYWREGSQGREGPFCQRCLDVDKIAVRLQEQRDGWMCTGCRTYCRK